MGDEKKYLTQLSDQLGQYVTKVEDIGDKAPPDAFQQIYSTLKEVIDTENKLRASCEIGARFNVIRTQLQELLKKYETDILAKVKAMPVKVEKRRDELLPDEQLVYVYLFNTQGAVLRTWQNLLTPRALIEHSVNRPIYETQEQAEALLRGKANKTQHAFLVVKVKKSDVLSSSPQASYQDVAGASLLRLRQGALRFENIVHFLFQEKTYLVNFDLSLSEA